MNMTMKISRTLEDEAYNKHELYQIIFEFSIN